jgi:hypothetical protein
VENAGKPVPGAEAGKTSVPEKLSGANEFAERRRKELGLTEIEDEGEHAWGDAWKRGKEAAEPGSTDRLAQDVAAGKTKVVTDTDHASFVQNQIATELEHAQAVDQVNSAKDPVEKEAAQTRPRVRENLCGIQWFIGPRVML